MRELQNAGDLDASPWDAHKQQWRRNPGTTWYKCWPAPTEKANLALEEGSGITPRNLEDRRLKWRIEADRRHVRLRLENLLVRQVERLAAQGRALLRKPPGMRSGAHFTS